MKRFRQISIVMVIVLLLFSSGVYGDTWSALKRLTSNAGRSYHPAIAVDGSNIYVVWFDYTPGNPEIFFKRSRDGGVTWTADKRLTDSEGFSSTPAIAVNGSNIYVVWWDYDYATGNSDIYFRRSVDGGSTWEAKMQLSKNAGFSSNPSIAVDGSNIYVVWEDDSPGNREVYLKRSVDGGVTWNANQRVTRNAGDAFWPSIAVDGPNIYVVWEDDTAGKPEIYFKRSVDGGVTWTADKLLARNSGGSYLPTMAAVGSKIYVAWHSYIQGKTEIFLKRSVDGGITWTGNQRLTNTAGGSWGPAIAVDGLKVSVVWNDDTTKNDEIYFKRSGDGGTTWTADMMLTKNTGFSWNPAIAANGSKVYVVWVDNTPGNSEIFFKKGVLD